MMPRNLTSRSLFVASLAGLALVASACAGEADGPDDVSKDSLSFPTEEEAFVEAIPGKDMLMLKNGTVGDDVSVRSNALSTREQELNYSELRDHTEELMSFIDDLQSNTHELIETIITHAPIQVIFNEANKECRAWGIEGDDGRALRLVSCRIDARAHRYGYVLQGRPAGAPAGDEGFLNLFAGEGVVMARHNGLQRGAGVVGYNFDNIRTFAPEEHGLQGQLLIGYRAAGPARVLNIALHEVQGDNDQDYSALYRFAELEDAGGRFDYVTHHDFLAFVNGELTEGQDGIDEFGRAAVAWTTDGRGRTAQAVCGGSIGERCIRVYQCWTADGAVSWEEILDNDGAPNWERSSCAPVPYDVDEPMDEDAFEVPEDNGEPMVEEPAAM